jgi:diaminopimelate epimerase
MNRETMQRLHFFKMTGTGNDFILIDNRKRIIDADQCFCGRRWNDID